MVQYRLTEMASSLSIDTDGLSIMFSVKSSQSQILDRQESFDIDINIQNNSKNSDLNEEGKCHSLGLEPFSFIIFNKKDVHNIYL